MNVGNQGITVGGRKLKLPKKINNGKAKENDNSDDDFVERKNNIDTEKKDNKMKRKRVEKIVKDKKVNVKGKKVIGYEETMGSCRISFIEKLIKCKDVSSINWCEYIVNCLEKSKNKWRPNDKNCYFTGPLAFLMMACAHRVICEDVNLQRYSPFITEIDLEHLRILEEYEVSKGIFGNLCLRENVEGVFYDEMMIQEIDRLRRVVELLKV
ncbi:unnamed protein product [Lactuca virosa]|uniref:Uncharacterized protein n=1 Tax=Lactuca virosa TaxID=75947 RepID=A0AAU9N986_9ASTR|nr:unnamed protein product [Lactuca virosa]